MLRTWQSISTQGVWCKSKVCSETCQCTVIGETILLQLSKWWQCVMVHVPSHAEIRRKMMLWRMQGNHLIKRNAPQKISKLAEKYIIPGRPKQHRVIMACDLYCCSIVEGFPRVALAAMQKVKPCFWHTENLLGPFNAVHNVLLQHHAFLSIWH